MLTSLLAILAYSSFEFLAWQELHLGDVPQFLATLVGLKMTPPPFRNFSENSSVFVGSSVPNANVPTCWSNFELIQVEPHTLGLVWNQCKWHYFLSWRDNSS